MVVSLIGMSRHGKDTVGSVFVENGFKRYALADEGKKMFCEKKNITLETLEKEKTLYRPELIEFIESFKDEDKYYWVKKLQSNIEEDLNNNINIVITDMRQYEEILFFYKLKESLIDDIPFYFFEVRRPIENGGVYDFDKNTNQGILFAHFNKIIDAVINNKESVEKLKEITEKIIKNILL